VVNFNTTVQVTWDDSSDRCVESVVSKEAVAYK